MATIAEANAAEVPELTLVGRFREFLWLASGMFSAAALSLSFLGYFTAGAVQDATQNFVAAVVAAVLFGVCTILKLGPDSK